MSIKKNTGATQLPSLTFDKVHTKYVLVQFPDINRDPNLVIKTRIITKDFASDPDNPNARIFLDGSEQVFEEANFLDLIKAEKMAGKPDSENMPLKVFKLLEEAIAIYKAFKTGEDITNE